MRRSELCISAGRDSRKEAGSVKPFGAQKTRIKASATWQKEEIAGLKTGHYTNRVAFSLDRSRLKAGSGE